MTELTKLDKPFIWSPECETAFDCLKSHLVSPEIMGYPHNDAGHFLLDVDASGIGIDGVLAQMQDGREGVMAYAILGLK